METEEMELEDAHKEQNGAEDAKNAPYGTFTCLACGETHPLTTSRARRFCDVCLEHYKVVACNIVRSKGYMNATPDEQMSVIVAKIRERIAKGVKVEPKRRGKAAVVEGVRRGRKPGDTKTCLFCGKEFRGDSDFCHTCRVEGYDKVYAVTGRSRARKRAENVQKDVQSADGWRGQRRMGGGSATNCRLTVDCERQRA